MGDICLFVSYTKSLCGGLYSSNDTRGDSKLTVPVALSWSSELAIAKYSDLYVLKKSLCGTLNALEKTTLHRSWSENYVSIYWLYSTLKETSESDMKWSYSWFPNRTTVEGGAPTATVNQSRRDFNKHYKHWLRFYYFSQRSVNTWLLYEGLMEYFISEYMVPDS